MEEKKQLSEVEKQNFEIKRLKRKNRRLDTILLIGLLQVGSLALCYYLGHSCNKTKR